MIPYYHQFPMHLILEVSSLCNSACVHCPNGAGLLKKKYKGLMSLEMAKNILNEVVGIRTENEEFNPQAILYGNGEPLLHPNITDIVRMAAERQLLPSLSTNMISLKSEHGKSLSKAGLSFIKLSFWGDNAAEYESRCKHSFSRALEKARHFIEACEDSVKIEINVVKYRNGPLEIAPDFLEYFSGYKDKDVEIYSFYGSDWAGLLPHPGLSEDLTEFNRKKEPCSHFRDNMMIAHDGTMMFCWLDFNRHGDCGKYKPGNLLSLWRQDARRHVINLMEHGKFDELVPCATCSAPYTERGKQRLNYVMNSSGAWEEKILDVHIYHHLGKKRGKFLPEYVTDSVEEK